MAWWTFVCLHWIFCPLLSWLLVFWMFALTRYVIFSLLDCLFMLLLVCWDSVVESVYLYFGCFCQIQCNEAVFLCLLNGFMVSVLVCGVPVRVLLSPVWMFSFSRMLEGIWQSTQGLCFSASHSLAGLCASTSVNSCSFIAPFEMSSKRLSA